MNCKLLTYSLMAVALTLAACSDDEYTVNLGDETQQQPRTPARPLVADMESVTVPGTEVSFNMVKVRAGTFTMGGVDADAPEHQVTLTRDFYIAQTEVTQALYRAVMDTSVSEFNYGDNYPVDHVSYNDAMDFCFKLRELTGYHFTLPTEAQWEYAARGGHRASPSATAYAGSDNIGSVAWYWNNSPQYQTENPVTHEPMLIRHTSEVRGKQPNELNIYDMTGNVREWCADWYSPLGTAAVTDPEGLSSAGYGRIYRGGSCNDSAQYCRVAHREGLSSSSKSYNIGFRVVITLD